jgi:predicted cupin superfamily sugar epimerase
VSHKFSADELIRLLDLKPLTIEGGFYRETYRAEQKIDVPQYKGQRPLSTAIYYLLTPETFSQMHRLPGEEIFHFYLGDPVEMLQLSSEGNGQVIRMGHDLAAGMTVQHVVLGGLWQGGQLEAGGAFALMGTTMAPGFDYADYESGSRDELIAGWPKWRKMIQKLCRE